MEGLFSLCRSGIQMHFHFRIVIEVKGYSTIILILILFCSTVKNSD